MNTFRFPLLFLAALLLVPGCQTARETRPHESLSPGAEPLRTQFNDDVGKVRLLMIVAPT